MNQETQDFIQEYGFPFIAFNKLERVLELIIRKKGRLDYTDSKLKDKIFERATLGQKFSLAEPFIKNRSLISKIEKLIRYRNEIVHKDLKIIHGDKGSLTGASINGKNLFGKKTFCVKQKI